MRTINDAGRKLIESFEQLRLEAYPDPGTGGDPWTIGYGHTGPDVHPGQRIDLTTAVGLLEQDLAAAERGIEAALHVEVTDNQFAALVSLAFNCGVHAIANSTLMRDLNAGQVQAAADQFLRWDRAGGRELRGLERRREAERALFLTPDAG